MTSEPPQHRSIGAVARSPDVAENLAPAHANGGGFEGFEPTGPVDAFVSGESRASVVDAQDAPDVDGGADPMLRKIVEALEAIRAEEFDYEILRAASDVTGEDVISTWRPSLAYLAPEKRDGEFHVTVYAQGACESCPIKQSHVGSIEPKVRELVGADNVFVHDYFDWFDGQSSQMLGE